HPSKDTSEDQKFLNQQSKNLRDLYNEIFDFQASHRAHDPTWWIRIFRQTGDQMLEQMKNAASTSFDENFEIVIKYGSKIFRANKDNRLLMIGRRSECDICFDEKLVDTSRLHALVYVMPELNLTAVVDVGSKFGIETLERGSKIPCEHSTPTTRKIIMLEYGEFAKLKFASETIIMSPKLCIICYENGRDHLFSCGHFIVCSACSTKITTCPICRAEITERHATNLNKTNAPSI
ncbi:MAG: forkhead associated FHA domain and RING domain protein, partial [Harvfovirus sp.]